MLDVCSMKINHHCEVLGFFSSCCRDRLEEREIEGNFFHVYIFVSSIDVVLVVVVRGVLCARRLTQQNNKIFSREKKSHLLTFVLFFFFFFLN